MPTVPLLIGKGTVEQQRRVFAVLFTGTTAYKQRHRQDMKINSGGWAWEEIGKRSTLVSSIRYVDSFLLRNCVLITSEQALLWTPAVTWERGSNHSGKRISVTPPPF